MNETEVDVLLEDADDVDGMVDDEMKEDEEGTTLDGEIEVDSMDDDEAGNAEGDEILKEDAIEEEEMVVEDTEEEDCDIKLDETMDLQIP